MDEFKEEKVRNMYKDPHIIAMPRDKKNDCLDMSYTEEKPVPS